MCVGEQFDRDVNEALVQKTDHDAGLAGHRGVDGVAREEIAEQRVLAVRRAAAHLIARVEVAHHDRDAFRFEERFDLLAQERTDVLQLHVAGGIARCRRRLRAGPARRLPRRR